MFTGTYTAIVTPFNRDGSVDFGCFRALVDWQIASGVDGLVPVGTTGESPTLEMDEHLKVIEAAVAAAAGRVPVIAGTGANSTAEALQLTRGVLNMGVAGTLQVTPYYNKPNQEGLFRHFSAVADLGLPVVLYNVPGRSSREIAVETVVRLAAHPQIVAIKEAGGSVERVSAIADACDLAILSGDDGLAVPMISVGAVGLISVASNVAPREVADMVRAACSGDFRAAGAAHRHLYPLFRDLFIDTNPIPVKAALSLLGRCPEVYRLPLCETSAKIREQIRATLSALNRV
ncbi:MAG: 4-hydroxy-tetrahydrodipicolinate synthase [Lentisphaerota bacterium]